MINKLRRILAFLLTFVMLSGVIGPDNLVLLTAYAEDEAVENASEYENTDGMTGRTEDAGEEQGEPGPADEQQGEPEPADEQQGEPEPADEEQGEPEPADEEQGEPEPADEEQGEPEPADEEQGELEPSDEEEDDADPSEDEETGTGEFLFEDSGKYVSVSITGSYPSEQKPAAHTAVIPDNEEYRVLEAWSVDGLSEDFSLKLTAQMIVLPELTEGESLSFVSLNGTTLGKELDKDMAAGDKLELELACESATGIALVKTVVKIEETEILYTAEDPLWANRDLYLTGKMPKNAVATAESVPIDIDGEEVLAAWDIKIYSAPDKVGTDEIWQPEDGAVQVHLRSDAFDGLEGTLNVYHMEDADGEAELVGTVETENEWISFDAESFSTYVVSIVLEKTITATDGKTYRITVAFDADSGIPSDAQLEVRELSGEEFDEYLGRTAVLMKAVGFGYARIFDITIVDGRAKERQPAKAVDVKVEMIGLRSAAEEYTVVHFGEQPEPVSAKTEGNVVSFSAESFSAYAIVDAPDPIPVEWEQIETIEDFDALLGQALYIGHPSGYYFTNEIYRVNNTRTGILKTTPPSSVPPSDAAPYFFEKDSNGKYRAYCFAGETKQYVKQSGNSLSFTSEEGATAFTVEINQGGTWQVRSNGYWWNQQGNEAGKGFAAYTENNQGSRLVFWHQKSTIIEDDPYGFDGMSFGLMSWSGAASGKAMMANAAGTGMLEAKALTVMTHQDDDEDKLFVPKDSDISFWTFEWKSDDLYYISAETDEGVKYLTLGDEGLSLSDTPCEIQVVPGTGIHKGEIYLRSGNTTLTYSGDVNTGFGVGGAVGSEWLYLVQLSELTSEYFMIYSAKKVSVSDVPNGERIIVYTRVWNDSKKKYEFYAVDHDGTLVPCFESGESIQWVGSMINTMLWNFTEYYWEGTQDPNFYYELYNQYEDQFIAPQLSSGQILQGSPIGINLDGREQGQYSSIIVTWDDGSYSYAGLKADRTTGKIVPCPYNEAESFFFATVQDLPVDDKLSTVPTVDHRQYGITVKIKDFVTRKEMSDFLGNDAGGIGTVLHQGLLSDTLGDDGYPAAVGGSLGTLLSGARDVNHLFIESTYASSGYYEYDSTQNFASLKDNNNFVVYREIGTYDSSGSRESLKHGQFFPFNDLSPGVFASVNGKNLYDANGRPLPDSDPRKNEKLYLINNVNCQFAVEIEASFIQTPSGLDAWGHDIIYEFTGDDDFWLYVDGKLVIDLGGIHSAVPGSVNYSTGDVYVNGRHTTLYEIFASHGMSEDELAEIFEKNDQNKWVFRDNTTHTMKIFYMERGGGASNLHMRFNLASTKKGTVELSKTISGIDAAESVLAAFPYQIWYKTEADGEPILYTNSAGVRYKDSVKSVPYRNSLNVGGTEYASVFLLKPNEFAVIELPEDALTYRIVECGVSTQAFGTVKVNGTVITGTAAGDQRRDYAIGFASSDERARVAYENIVAPDALRTLSITKKLYKEDGVTPVTADEDSTAFSFRLYLGAEFDSELQAASKHDYHIRDEQGRYCTWDLSQNDFVPSEWDDYSEIPAGARDSVTFKSSINGQISRIHASYTVEIRNVLAGTKFRVVERPADMPDGYSFQKYVYTDLEGAHEYTDAQTGVQDEVRPNEDPRIDVCNLRGWGLRVNKIWTDTDYMDERADTYFAVFTDNGSGDLTLVDGTVRRLRQNENTLYWYFLPLPVPDVPFRNYLVREVCLSAENPTVDAEGRVTDYGTITIVEDGDTIEIAGRQKGETAVSDFSYTVRYQKGSVSEGSNIRVDTVTNNRPGVVLRKEDWSGNPLAGTDFTLTDCDGNVIGNFTSDELGQITVAFLRENVDYTLTETSTPQGITGISPMTIRFSGTTVSVSGVDAKYYAISQEEGEMPVLTVKNRPYIFQVIKQNKDGVRLSGALFALHRQVTVDGVTIIETEPMPGYADLVTNGEGIVPKLDNTLPPGTYQLREKAPPEGYAVLSAYIHFTVSPIGEVSLGVHPDGVELTKAEDGDDPIAFTMTIRNEPGLPAPTNFGNAEHRDGYWLLFSAGIMLAMGSALPALRRRRKRERLCASFDAPGSPPASSCEDSPGTENARSGTVPRRAMSKGPPLEAPPNRNRLLCPNFPNRNYLINSKKENAMKKSLKKLAVLVLAVLLMTAMTTAAFADTTIGENGEQGAFTSPDTPVSQSKILVLEKELKAYNLDAPTINAPTISYTYTIAAATVPTDATVTDAPSKHASNSSVTVPVKAGLGTPTIANSGVVAWSPAETLTADTAGASNKKEIAIDFSSVVFTGAGVYRYVLNEALTDGTYAASGVTETDGTHARYIDVYVRPVPTGFGTGLAAADWDIYGFTCFYNNSAAITEDNKTTVPVKTTGFVAGTSDGSQAVSADSYYTFNLTLTKTVVNDAYGASTVAFPFTVLFTNAAVTKNVDIIGTVEADTVSGWTNPAAAALSAGTTNGIVNIKSGGQIKYVGIPNGTAVEVYETNTATGVVYKVDTALTTSSMTTSTDNSVTWGSAPSAAVSQSTRAAYESTKATFSTTANADDDNDYTVAITNTLLTISPTGVTLRVAPYVLMLGAGLLLVFFSRRRRARAED